MGERRPCKAEVVGSNPISSTRAHRAVPEMVELVRRSKQQRLFDRVLLRRWQDLGCAVRCRQGSRGPATQLNADLNDLTQRG